MLGSNCECRSILTAAFEEAALALGGVVAGYPIPDEATWDLARALDLIHERALARFGRCGSAEPEVIDEMEGVEHPAIVHLLRRLHARPQAMVAGNGSGR